MKRLHLQLQPSLSPSLNVSDAIAHLQRLAVSTVTEGEDNGHYINFGYETVDLLRLWEVVHEVILLVPGLSQAVICCCEGQHGWDDYLLLHHYDLMEPLDELS